MTFLADPKVQRKIDELTKTLTLGAVSANLSRFDSKERNLNSEIYREDRIELCCSKHRAFIREAYCGEFDYSQSNTYPEIQYSERKHRSAPQPNEILRSLSKRIPRLWVLVTDVGNNMNHVTAIYRGEPLWKLSDRNGRDTARFESNEEYANAIAIVQEREGVNDEEYIRFIETYLSGVALVFHSNEDGKIN